MILRSRSGRFSNIADSREFQLLLQEEILSLLLAEKYGLLLIMEQGKGTRYEHLRPTMVALIAQQIEPLLADEENALLLAQIMADNLVGGIIQILKNRVRPREVRVCMNRLLDYHTKGDTRASRRVTENRNTGTKTACTPGFFYAQGSSNRRHRLIKWQ